MASSIANCWRPLLMKLLAWALILATLAGWAWAVAMMFTAETQRTRRG